MSSGGHNAKPDNVLKLHGTFRRDRQGVRGVKSGGEPLRKPETLGEAGAALWDHITKTRAAWLCSSDAETLQALCELWELRTDALQLLRADCTDKLVRCAFISYQQEFGKLAARFGLTPADRARLGEGGDAHAKKDELEDLLA